MAKGTKTGGRKKGTPNKATVAVKEALVSAFNDLGGVDALTRWGIDNQTEFYKLWSKILPQEIRSDVTLRKPITEMTDDELNEELAEYERTAGTLLPRTPG